MREIFKNKILLTSLGLFMMVSCAQHLGVKGMEVNVNDAQNVQGMGGGSVQGVELNKMENVNDTNQNGTDNNNNDNSSPTSSSGTMINTQSSSVSSDSNSNNNEDSTAPRISWKKIFADPGTFHRENPWKSFFGGAVLSFCGGVGLYYFTKMIMAAMATNNMVAINIAINIAATVGLIASVLVLGSGLTIILADIWAQIEYKLFPYPTP